MKSYSSPIQSQTILTGFNQLFHNNPHNTNLKQTLLVSFMQNPNLTYKKNPILIVWGGSLKELLSLKEDRL